MDNGNFMFCMIAPLSGWGYQRQLRVFLGKTCINRTNKRSSLRVDGGAGAACHAGSQAPKLSSTQTQGQALKHSSWQAQALRAPPAMLALPTLGGRWDLQSSLPPAFYFLSTLSFISSPSLFFFFSSVFFFYSFFLFFSFSHFFFIVSFPFYSSLPTYLFLLISPRSVIFLAMLKESSWAFT